MKKTLIIDGMSCTYCKADVEEVLNALPGITAEADPQKGEAYIKIEGEVDESLLISVIDEHTAFRVSGVY
ncbi:copper chaperone [Desulfovibrio sp. DS-1]|jgi:Heavy-metal-associated domain.|nr:copper chaperone [Desulfovibrio sp. DS-1]